jgi:hypothetical protein
MYRQWRYRLACLFPSLQHRPSGQNYQILLRRRWRSHLERAFL